ncbi:MAG: fatty acid cis/trans isomerase [Desulforhopalus sp.]|nr:fatty acid cis/trans isomerase [Desulforhopalus sp.]
MKNFKIFSTKPSLLLFVLLFLGTLAALGGCSRHALPPVAIALPERVIDYQAEVQPILVKRCVVCHSCYNSPCQLKLESFEGLDRGATKKAVYDASRLQTMAPTRLFMDAATTAEWRSKGFFSVTASSSTHGSNDSQLIQLLDQKRKTPLQHLDSFSPETDELTCAESGEELGAYLKKHPNRGMPYGFPPLSEEQFTTIAGWLAQGAKGPDARQQAMLEAIPPDDQLQIDRWEEFFNRTEAKFAMTARYLYEHLFLAHLHFAGSPAIFYELVRSRTPPGEKIEIIATELPYDDPGTTSFYYRFRKIHTTIVHKTHMVFSLSEERLRRLHQLFIEPDWLEEPHRIGYEREIAANPFKAFEQIPPRARYQFLLDNIQYIIMTFIHGPVCKGQVALNVIRDHFWLLFLDPEADLSIKDPGFLQTYGDLLEMPAVEKSDLRLARHLFSQDYRKRASEFVQRRSDYYASRYRYRELDHRAIWPGNSAADTPLLTVFRHFDSASVHPGPLGDLPETVWVIDYPLLERIYYSLVAGFNIYGNALHQLAARVYMDELRQEGETYFVDFMPRERRREMMREWNGGIDLDKLRYAPSPLAAGFSFTAGEPKREFVEYLVDRHLPVEIGIAFDHNYLRAGEEYPEMPRSFSSAADYLQGFKAVSRPGVSFFTRVHDHNANLAYVRILVNDREAEDVYLSVVINRWHDDVTTMFGEEQRLRPEWDRAVFLRGFIGSYPNYFFEVALADLPDFLDILDNYDGSPGSVHRLARYGVNRADDHFWEVYDRFQERFLADEPLYGGLFDLNRYYHLALRRGEE